MAAPGRCPHCDSELSGDLPEGLCPGCLFGQAVAGPGTVAYREEPSRSPAPAFVPPTPAELAEHFPHLEIVRLIGQGGMGAVYQARQPDLDRLLAVKVLPPQVAHDPGFTERFSREARALARLSHPHVVTIFDYGVADGLYYFTMEYVDGGSLRELLQAGGMEQSRAVKVVAQLCDALQYAHDEGFVHRDIKPENILVDRKGRVKIADFGLARLVGMTPTYLTLTHPEQVMGTLFYMAPEQMKRAHSVDHRADLYSLGVVFYEMLTGELPIGRFAPPSHRSPVDPRLDAIVLRALAREPEQRYQDAAQIRQDVESAVAGGGPAPSPQPLSPEPWVRAAGAAPAALAAPRPVWPCVRFTIPHISWAGAYVRGEMFRDETTLILDCNVVSSVGTSKHRQVRIPLAEILMITCRTGQMPGLARWLGAYAKTEIVLKTDNPAALKDLPAGKDGRGRLRVHRDDREAAQQLVDSILRTPLPPPAAKAPAKPAAGRARTGLAGPAMGLMLTAAVTIATTVVGAVQVAQHFHRAGDVSSKTLAIIFAAAFMPVCVGVLMAGALQMLRGRSYLLCVAAALLAIVPWSPAWVFGLPSGIWALVVLGRPEVITAFLNNRRGLPPGPAVHPPPPPRPAGGKVQSWLRSFAGYFLTTLPRPAARSRDAE
jgi:hypothetical protein